MFLCEKQLCSSMLILHSVRTGRPYSGKASSFKGSLPDVTDMSLVYVKFGEKASRLYSLNLSHDLKLRLTMSELEQFTGQ